MRVAEQGPAVELCGINGPCRDNGSNSLRQHLTVSGGVWNSILILPVTACTGGRGGETEVAGEKYASWFIAFIDTTLMYSAAW